MESGCGQPLATNWSLFHSRPGCNTLSTHMLYGLGMPKTVGSKLDQYGIKCRPLHKCPTLRKTSVSETMNDFVSRRSWSDCCLYTNSLENCGNKCLIPMSWIYHQFSEGNSMSWTNIWLKPHTYIRFTWLVFHLDNHDLSAGHTVGFSVNKLAATVLKTNLHFKQGFRLCDHS